jgi:acetyl-CoA carboxylase biotin carboxylase subunit
MKAETAFKKVLVANRGEIAVRIIRACHEMELEAVAVFSSADETALHVQLADEAEWIGPPPASQSYLDIDRIIAAARKHGADAIHPGYGFLSERAEFADAVKRAGIRFIGPEADVIEKMGDKLTARELARQADVPLVPGSDGPVKNMEEARMVAEEIGYPVMIKASAGGGGKGMRLVQKAEELESSFQRAASEAQSSFGDDTVYIEKFITSPRHIEIQVLADDFGNVIHLGERECSVQRRHQKLIEETPSCVIDEELRQKIGAAAVRITQQCGYRNAGTVEFIMGADKKFYFLEMNTRLQVEHPITEMVTGVDLVKQQFRIASGKPLQFQQSDIRQRGAAIEARIYAEDADNNFVPSPGQITYLLMPGGPGVRVDGGIYAGYTVPLDYDPILAKFCVWAETRDEAIARMRRALRETRIGGIITSVTFIRRILGHEHFRTGQYHTGFLDSHSDELSKPRDYGERVLAALAVSEQAHDEVVQHVQIRKKRSRWKESGRRRQMVH